MSTSQELNSEPEIINSDDSAVCNCSCHKKEEVEKTTDDVEEEPQYSIIENTGLFLVNIEGEITFYCNTLEDALDQARDYLRNLKPDNENRTYYLNEEAYSDRNVITLVSLYKWYAIQYERVEAVATISEISRIQFTTQKSD